MAELYGRSTGVSKGWGGSMHLFDAEPASWAATASSAASCRSPSALPSPSTYRGSDEVVMCQMGDGTTNIGAFHESLNIASAVEPAGVFVVINNFTRYGHAGRALLGRARTVQARLRLPD